MAEMTGLVALGYMLIEKGKIVAIRNEELGLRLNIEELKSVGGGIKTIVTLTKHMEADGWEIGWRCFRCMGDGVVMVPCPCVQRERHIQAADPCCDGWDEMECSECVGGIRWEEEY